MQGLWNLIGKVGQGAGKDFPFEIGEPIHGLEGNSVWTLHKGKKKSTGELVTVFVCDGKTSPPDELHVAKAGYKRLRTLRHPNILKFIDGYETEALVYMVTEPVQPLALVVNTEECKNPHLISWGIHQVTSTISFLVNDSNLIHGNVNMFSIFVDLAGEWKVGGVEYVHSETADPIARLPSLTRYDPPEGFINKSKQQQKWSSDAWGLGCLIWEVFNGPLQKSADLKLLSKIPKTLVPYYCELVTANPKSRINPKQFLENCMKLRQYLDDDFVHACLFLQEIQIKDTKEQKEFFQKINNSLDSFPQHFCIHKILPQLLNAFEFGAAGSTVLSPLFKVGKLLEAEEYQKKIVPCVIKLFSSNDRATRIQLLQQMDNFIHHLQEGVVNDQIFPNIATGFGDTLPAMREQTVKSTVFLAPKLTEKTINNHLLKYFAKLQMDEQPGIRTNTTICLGKIASYIPKNTRSKVLVPAFIRASRDPFPPARSAAVLAMAATQEYYEPSDFATRLLPSLSSLLIDPEKSVRTNAFKVTKSFVAKLEGMSNDPESCLNKKSTDQSNSEQSGASWTGWAVSSLTSRLYGQGGQTEVKNNGSLSQSKSPTNGQVAQIKETAKETTNVDHESDKEKSGSDYQSDGGWSDENWEDVREDNVLEGMRKDLLSVQQELRASSTDVGKRKQTDKGNEDDSDHSDYGDWGNEDWGFGSNSTSDFTVKQSGPASAKKVLSSYASDQNKDASGNDIFGNFDWTDSSRTIVEDSVISSNDGWDQPSDGWEVDWQGTEDNDDQSKSESVEVTKTALVSNEKKATDKEARKAQLLKAREERRLAKQEGSTRAKKPSKGGAMKLGAVKQIKENTD